MRSVPELSAGKGVAGGRAQGAGLRAQRVKAVKLRLNSVLLRGYIVSRKDAKKEDDWLR
jgi:hypothetical protein